MTIEDQFIGKKLRERRVLLGVSQGRLGSIEGLTFQQIQKYETGKNRISAGRLWRFAMILHVHIFYFFDGLEKAIEEHKLAGNQDLNYISDFGKLEELDNMADKLETEINRLNKNFVKIKNAKLRRSVLNLTKGLAESEIEDQNSKDNNENINKK